MKAFHLPDLDYTGAETFPIGALDIQVPRLSAQDVRSIVERITAARSKLLELSDDAVVSAIDAAAQILADGNTDEGRAARNLLPAATGYSSETIEDILQHMCSDWSAPSLQRLLDSEAQASSERTVARGPRVAYHIFSGNVPGVSVTSLLRALLVRSASIGKMASGEPVLPILFLRALDRIAPSIADCIAVTYWPSERDDLHEAALQAADVVIVYGGEDAVRSVASHPRAVIHGPKISFGVVGSDPSAALAHEVARACAAYDQQGCVSPQTVFVHHAASPRALAEAIAEDLEAIELSMPRRKLAPAEAVAVRNARTTAEFRAIGGDDVDIYGSDSSTYAVIYDAAARLTPSCLNRTLYIHPFESIDEVRAAVEPHRSLLQSAAIAGFNNFREVAMQLIDAGVTRITSFEKLPWPPMEWKHDGRGPLRELLTYHDIEV